MKSILLIIVIVLCQGMVSCGMQKNVHESRETYAHSSDMSAESAVLEQKVKSMVRECLSESIERFTLQELVSDREIYSDPDSSGRQYIVERTRTVMNTNITEKQTGHNVTESVDSTAIDIRKIVREETETDTNEVVDTEDEHGLTWWQKILVWIGTVSSGLIILKLLLRWR